MGFYFSVVYIHTLLIYFVQLAPSLSSESHFKLSLILMTYTYHFFKSPYFLIYTNVLGSSRTLSASALDSSISLRNPYSFSRKCSWEPRSEHWVCSLLLEWFLFLVPFRLGIICRNVHKNTYLRTHIQTHACIHTFMWAHAHAIAYIQKNILEILSSNLEHTLLIITQPLSYTST